MLSPAVYIGVSVIDDTKRTDYPGKEISRLVQNKWDDNFINDIKIVVGDEWFAGNLSYHLTSRPKWINDLRSMASGIDSEQELFTQEIQRYQKSLSWNLWDNKTSGLLYDWKKMKKL